MHSIKSKWERRQARNFKGGEMEST